MSRIHLRESSKTLTSHVGLALIGDCLALAQVNKLDSRFPTSRGMKSSDIIKSYVGLLSLGQSDFEAITNRGEDPAFRKLLQVARAPSVRIVVCAAALRINRQELIVKQEKLLK